MGLTRSSTEWSDSVSEQHSSGKSLRAIGARVDRTGGARPSNASGAALMIPGIAQRS